MRRESSSCLRGRAVFSGAPFGACASRLGAPLVVRCRTAVVGPWRWLQRPASPAAPGRLPPRPRLAQATPVLVVGLGLALAACQAFVPPPKCGSAHAPQGVHGWARLLRGAAVRRSAASRRAAAVCLAAARLKRCMSRGRPVGPLVGLGAQVASFRLGLFQRRGCDRSSFPQRVSLCLCVCV